MNRGPWMAQLPDGIRNLPIYKLLLPGSHDSAAYQYDPSVTFPSSALGWTYWFMSLPGAEDVVKNWMTTQSYTLTDQLNLGIRKLDLRVSYHTESDTYYFTHTFAGIKAQDGLYQISRFLHIHSSEVVILKFSKDDRNRKRMKGRMPNFLRLAIDMFSDKLILNNHDNTLLPAMTLNALAAKGQQVLLLYDSKFSMTPHVWNIRDRHLTEFTSDLNIKWNIIDQYLAESMNIPNDGQQLSEIALTLTPDDIDVSNAVLNPWANITSTRDLTDIMHASMYTRLATMDLSQINALMVDFPTERFVTWVINYNLNTLSSV